MINTTAAMMLIDKAYVLHATLTWLIDKTYVLHATPTWLTTHLCL
jgi:hypothetical protein